MKNRGKDAQILNNFDYNSLESKQRSIIELRTEEIKERLKRSAQDIWEIGQKIFEVRSQLGYGSFDSWLKAEFGWSRRTAYNFIKVYEAFPERATVAQVSIAASALYQLSSPSTPKKIRDELIERAKQGEKITRQDIRSALESKKLSSSDSNSILIPSPAHNSKQDIVSVIRKPTSTIKPSLQLEPIQNQEIIENLPLESKVKSKGWYSLGHKHFLFYGDTASEQFYKVIPQVSLTIAITANDWDHDWLIDRSDNLVVLKEPFLSQESISTFISLLSQPEDIVLFPWLPDRHIIELSHKLERIVIAGDSNLDNCQKAIAQAQLTVEAVSEFKKL